MSAAVEARAEPPPTPPSRYDDRAEPAAAAVGRAATAPCTTAAPVSTVRSVCAATSSTRCRPGGRPGRRSGNGPDDEAANVRR